MESVTYNIKSLTVIVKKEKPSKIIIVSSSKIISKLHWAVKKIEKITNHKMLVLNVPDGEKAKDWKVLEGLLKNFIKAKLDRKSLIIALGGGSITDLVGFACSIYKRGIKYINIPTNLLGMADASIGGKTAINFVGYKNQIGSFYKPLTTIIDTRFLKYLDKDQIIDGFAEIIKAGLIKDASILKILEKYNMQTLARSRQIGSLIEKSIHVKNYFSAKDKNDTGIRQILNFGHTVGHAIELEHGLTHGRAVFMGMIKELEVGERLVITNPSVKVYLDGILKNNSIILDKKYFKIKFKNILSDKKISGGYIMLPVITKIGKSKLVKVKISVVRQMVR